VYGRIHTVTADYEAETDVGIILVNATSAPLAINLPLASETPSRAIVVKKIDASGNAVTITPNGSETIDGAASLAISTQWESKMFITNGEAWFTI
jgi:hypothetical protein